MWSNIVMKAKKIIETVLAAVLSAASFIQMIPNPNVDAFFGNNLVILFLIACAIALGVILIIDIVNICHTIHRFEKGSIEFCNFFTKWYSKPGKLTLICDDLNWTTVEIDSKFPILDALEKKANTDQLVLYLKKKGDTSQDILRKLSAAKIKFAPDNIVNKYSFSCLNYMGNNSAVIIRDKNKDSGNEVIFQELADTYVTQLLNSLLEV